MSLAQLLTTFPLLHLDIGWPTLLLVLLYTERTVSRLTNGRGLTESVRQQWENAFHMFASVHDAMRTAFGQHQTNMSLIVRQENL